MTSLPELAYGVDQADVVIRGLDLFVLRIGSGRFEVYAPDEGGWLIEHDYPRIAQRAIERACKSGVWYRVI